MAGANIGFDELQSQLRVTNILLVELLTRQFELKQSELIEKLASAGTPSAEIANILGTSINTVQVTVSRAKKKKTAKK